MVQQFVGRHWSEEAARLPVPVNLIGLYVKIMGRFLIAKNPRVMLGTFYQKDKATVDAMQSWCNKEIVAMDLQATLQRVVTDALFSIGICKVALATPAESAAAGWSLRAGQPFAERVDLDDFVFDIHARSFEEVSYIGHRYRVPLDVVREGREYDKSRKDLTASEDPLFNLEGDERISTLGRGFYGDQHQEVEDMVDLWEVYLPRHRLVYTLANDYLLGPNATGAKPLRVQRWIGPDRGPYHIFSYGTVPGNCMPKGPIMDLVDLHEAANRGYRKLIRTMDRIKELGLVSKQGTEDGQRALEANDGDLIGVNDPKNFTQLVMGGAAAQTLLLLATNFKDLFDFMAGNLSLLSGGAPQAKTLGQDRMLQENANGTVADMQDETINKTAGVLRALCWYWHHDPISVRKSLHEIAGVSSVPRAVTPTQRQQVPFEDMDIGVDPYSMQRQTPQQRMGLLNQVVQQTLMPLLSLLQQQGITFDVNKYLQKIARYQDMPDLAEIITIAEPPAPEAGGGEKPGMAPQTTRTYNRTDTGPGRTEKGNTQNLMNTLMGVNPGGAQQPAMNGALR